MFLATHAALQQRGYCGLNVMLVAELEGRLESAALEAAVRRLAARYPEMSAQVEARGLRQRPYRVVDVNETGAIEFISRDMSQGEDPAEANATVQRAALGDVVRPESPRPVKLIHSRLGAGRHVLTLRWPHHLMDLKGGLMLVEQLDAILCDRPPTVSPDPGAPQPSPFTSSWPMAGLRALRGAARHIAHCVVNQPRLVQKPASGTRAPDFLVRHLEADERRTFERVSRQRTSPGPLRHVRSLLAAVARLYLHTARMQGRPRKRHLFSHALPLPGQGDARGLLGNHITIPWVGLEENDLATWKSADAAIARQLFNYTQRGHDADAWAMLKMAQAWPFPLARFLAAHRHPRAAAGLTSYRFGATPRTFGGAAVTRLFATGTMNCHPGWIVADSTYRDTMTITMGYFPDHVDPRSMHAFSERLLELLLGADIEDFPDPGGIRAEPLQTVTA